MNKGLLCQKAGDLDGAEKLYLCALYHQENDLTSLINLGNVAFARKDFSKAIAYYNQVIELDFTYETGWYNLALAFKANLQPDLSKKCFEHFIDYSEPTDSRRDYALQCLG